MPSDEAKFSKRPPRKSPRAWAFGAKSFKSAGNKKLFKKVISLKTKETISSFERKSSHKSLAQKFLEWSNPHPPPPHTLATCHSPMTDISVIRPLRWSFWWRIYPSYGTQRVKARTHQAPNSYKLLSPPQTSFGFTFFLGGAFCASPPPPRTTSSNISRIPWTMNLKLSDNLNEQVRPVKYCLSCTHPWSLVSYVPVVRITSNVQCLLGAANEVLVQSLKELAPRLLPFRSKS